MQLFGLPRGRKMESPEDREFLLNLLSRSDHPQVKMMLLRASLPDFASTSLAKIMEDCGLNFHMISREITSLYKSEGFIRSAQHLPEIMEQVAVDAKSKESACKACSGTGKVRTGKNLAEESCKKCDGTGKVYKLGDVERLRLMFETFGLTGKAGGGVNVNLDLRQPSNHETLDSLSQSIAPILEGVVTREGE